LHRAKKERVNDAEFQNQTEIPPRRVDVIKHGVHGENTGPQGNSKETGNPRGHACTQEENQVDQVRQPVHREKAQQTLSVPPAQPSFGNPRSCPGNR
jgi:hypothetical protein